LQSKQTLPSTPYPRQFHIARKPHFEHLGSSPLGEDDRRDFKKKATRQRIESEIRDVLVKSPGANIRELVKLVTGNHATICDVIQAMEESNAIQSKKDGKAEKYYLTEIETETRIAA
jgi:predicted transcriptional regulator